MTPPRQVWLFELACWLAIVAAVVHLVGHVMVGGTSLITADAAVPPYLLRVPGQDMPTTMAVANGLSLSLSLLLATIGAAGVAVAKRGYDDPLLLRGVARAFAIGTSMLLVLSVLLFFSLLSFFIAPVALCFAMASVTET